MHKALKEAFRASRLRKSIAWHQDHQILGMIPLKQIITPEITTMDGPSPPLDRHLGHSPQASPAAPSSWEHATNARLQGSRVSSAPPAEPSVKQKEVHTLPEALPPFHGTSNLAPLIKSRLAIRPPRRGWSCLARHFPTQATGYPQSVVSSMAAGGAGGFSGYHATSNPVHTGHLPGSAPPHTMAGGAAQLPTPPPQSIFSVSTHQPPDFEDRVAAAVASDLPNRATATPAKSRTP